MPANQSVIKVLGYLNKLHDTDIKVVESTINKLFQEESSFVTAFLQCITWDKKTGQLILSNNLKKTEHCNLIKQRFFVQRLVMDDRFGRDIT